MYCNGCGAKLPDDSQFCSECGKDLMAVSRVTRDKRARTPRHSAARGCFDRMNSDTWVSSRLKMMSAVRATRFRLTTDHQSDSQMKKAGYPPASPYTVSSLPAISSPTSADTNPPWKWTTSGVLTGVRARP